MKKHCFLLIALLSVSLFSVGQQNKEANAVPEPGVVKVKLNYTGAGTVDQKHRIVLFYFTSPRFTEGAAVPFADRSAAEKDGTVTLEGVRYPTIYVATIYDPAGGFDGMSGEPPKGSSLGMYATPKGEPAPINVVPNQTVEVTLTFDDTAKMP